MSTELPSCSNSSSCFALPEFARGDIEREPYVDAFGDSYIGLGGGADPDAGFTPLFEKEFCSNFTCCGLTLADLHELVGHFEECHVLVVGPNGALGGPTGFPASLGMHTGGSLSRPHIATRLGPRIDTAGTGTSFDTTMDESCSAVTPRYSSSSAPSTAPSSSLNSPISPYTSPSPHPNRFPTLTSAFTPSEILEGESAFASVTVEKENYEHADDAAKDYIATHPQNHGQNQAQNHSQNLSTEQHALGLSFDTLLHPSAYSTSASLPSTTPASVDPEHTIYATNPSPSATITDSSRCPTAAKMVASDATANSMHSQPIAPVPIYAHHPSLSIISDLSSVSTPSPNQNGRPADRNSNSKRRRPATAKGIPRQREKNYKCPRPGCIKSYLNVNGLKYHLEKGTCDFGEN